MEAKIDEKSMPKTMSKNRQQIHQKSIDFEGVENRKKCSKRGTVVDFSVSAVSALRSTRELKNDEKRIPREAQTEQKSISKTYREKDVWRIRNKAYKNIQKLEKIYSFYSKQY